MSEEIWKTLPQCEEYEISNLGRVRRSSDLQEVKLLTLRNKKAFYKAFEFRSKKESRRIRFYVHRLVYMTFVGPITEGFEIDHKDRNASNNEVSNLRLATRAQNSANSKTQRTNLYKGVKKLPVTGKWGASLGRGPGSIYLGSFYTAEAAALSFNIASKEKYGEFAFQNALPDDEVIQNKELEAREIYLTTPREREGKLSTKYRGVSRYHGKFQASIMLNDQRKHLGTHNTADEALAARNAFIERCRRDMD